jgi:Flp pilus assembly protein TadD
MKRPAGRPNSAKAAGNVWKTTAAVAVIAIATALVYLPVRQAGFVWDDEQLITGNPLLRDVSGLAEIWSGGRTADYFPITNTIFWIEHHIFGENTGAYHIVNVVLQAANALLVWFVLQRLNVPGAWLAGLIFAIHPVNAESVAWISELKNVLSLFFALLSTICFFEIEDQRLLGRATAYFASICFFVLSLLSKSQAVFVPIVLLLCGWWRSGSADKGSSRREAIRTLPFFLAALGFGLVTIWFQNRGIGGEEIVTGSLGRRIVNAAMALWWYGAKVFVPVRLVAIYPPWRFGSVRGWEFLPLIGLGALILLLWSWRDRGTRGAFFAAVCFIVALSPVLGFFRMAYLRSGTLVADHLQYFADVSLIALFGAGVACIWRRAGSVVRSATTALVAIALIVLGSYTSMRAEVFHDEEALWSDTLSKNPDAWQGHARLGKLFFDQRRYADALSHLQRAVELKPDLADNRNLLGLDYCRLERFEEGISEYRMALQLKQSNSSAAETESVATIRTNLANALAITANNLSTGTSEISQEAKRRYDEAIDQYERALELEPRHPAIHRNLGMVLARLGRYEEAASHLRTTLEMVPNEPVARETLKEIEAKRQ